MDSGEKRVRGSGAMDGAAGAWAPNGRRDGAQFAHGPDGGTSPRRRPHAGFVRACRAVCLALAVVSVVPLAAPAARASDEHLHHPPASGTPVRATMTYRMPDVRLVRDDGRDVALAEELGDGRPVVLAFIYTSCTTICPLTSQTLAEVQRRLGVERVHLMSITIDPEQDTPDPQHRYAQQFHAGPHWQHYSGSLAASQAVQRAFGVFRGDKMNHVPALFVRAVPGDGWVRIDGFPTADDVLAELPQMRAAQ